MSTGVIPQTETRPGGLRAAVRQRPILAFSVLLVVLSWPFMLLVGDNVLIGMPALLLLGPGACAFLVSYLADGPAGVRELAGRVGRWRQPARWYLFVLFGMGGAILLTAYGVTAALFPDELAPPPAGVLVPLVLNFVVIFVVAGLGEELGWRGFVLPRLQGRLSPVRATLVVGLLWFAWHLPLRIGGEDWMPYLGLFLVLVVADSFIYTWVFNRTGGSVLLVALMHAAGNTWGGHLYGQTFSFEPPGYLFFEVVRIGIYVIVAVAVVLLTRGRLGHPCKRET